MSNFLATTHYALGDPIVALATPYGKSALAVIRISGDGVIGLFKPFFSNAQNLKQQATLTYGYIADREGKRIDQLMVAPFFDPHSYTGEESLELYTHGSMVVVNQILSLLLTAGFRMALPGEFSYRAYLLGKMDLLQAEAVHDLIDAKSSLASGSALLRLEGKLSLGLEATYQKTLTILATLNAHLDYPDEFVEAIATFKLDQEIAHLKHLIEQSGQSIQLNKGFNVVLAGHPNTGKSSLFNALLNQERALVSPLAGTTRDYLEQTLEIEGFAINFIDTAGLHFSDHQVEKLGIAKSLELLARADLILGLVSVDQPTLPPDLQDFSDKTLWVANKSDLGAVPEGFLGVSALKGDNLASLKKAILKALKLETTNLQQPLLGSLRQQQLCTAALTALQQFEDLQAEATLDELAYFVKIASHSLADLLGKESDKEAMDAMFSNFCLGK